MRVASLGRSRASALQRPTRTHGGGAERATREKGSDLPPLHPRHHQLSPAASSARRSWPSPELPLVFRHPPSPPPLPAPHTPACKPPPTSSRTRSSAGPSTSTRTPRPSTSTAPTRQLTGRSPGRYRQLLYTRPHQQLRRLTLLLPLLCVVQGTNQVQVVDAPVPDITHDKDVILRVTGVSTTLPCPRRRASASGLVADLPTFPSTSRRHDHLRLGPAPVPRRDRHDAVGRHPVRAAPSSSCCALRC